MATIKKRRGRPRREEPIGDFDLQLIQQFSSRPAFYDKSSLNYKNKDFLEAQWEEMAREMGHDVNTLKERMAQIRNRYNLEKRRIEIAQRQYPKKIVKSAWPLYTHLAFLSDHIKGRRSFRTMRARNPYRNVKYEEGSSSEAEYAEEGEGGDDTQDGRNENTLDNYSRNFCTMVHNGPGNSTNGEKRIEQPRIKTQRATDNGVEKFKAFGNFLTTSLIEMDEKDALSLIEKITSQLVHSMLSEPKNPVEKRKSYYQMNGDIDRHSGSVSDVEIL